MEQEEKPCRMACTVELTGEGEKTARELLLELVLLHLEEEL